MVMVVVATARRAIVTLMAFLGAILYRVTQEDSLIIQAPAV